MTQSIFTKFNRSFFKKVNEYEMAKQLLPDSFSENHIDLREVTDSNIVILKNGDLGVIYKVSGVYDEILDMELLSESLNPFMKAFRSITGGIPAHLSQRNVSLQFLMKQREISSPPLKQNKEGYPVTFSNTSIGNILDREEQNLFKIGLIQRDFYFSIRFTPSKLEKNKSRFMTNILSSLGNSINGEKQNDFDLYFQSMELFENELSILERQFPLSYQLVRQSKNNILSLLQNMLFAGEDKTIFDEEATIEKCLYSPNYKDNKTSLISTDDNKAISTFHFEQLPKNFSYGKTRHFLDAIPYKNFDMVWIFTHGAKEFTKDLIARETFYGRKKTSNIEFEEFQSFRKNISSQKPHGTQSCRLIVYNPQKEKAGLLESLAQDYIGGRLVQEKQITTHMFVTSLPLNCRSSSNKLKGRCRKIRLENALAFIPLFCGPPSNHGIRYHVSRNLTPTRFDLFAGEGNKIGLALGMSRAGKSVLTNNLILEFLEKYPAGIVRIIDIKTSYLKLCDLLNGKVIKFSEEELKKNAYSPFALGETYDTDDLEAIYLLIYTAIIQKNPGIKFSAIHTELLREALKIAYNSNLTTKIKFGLENSSPHPIWEDVIASLPQAECVLKSSGVQGVEQANKEISIWSVNLYQTGQFGFIFNRHESLDNQTHTSKILVYDLDGNTDEVLRQLSAMMAFIKITRDLAKLPTSTPKLIIFEEFGVFLHGDDEAQKVNEQNAQLIVKTAAKLNGQPFAISNNVDDFAVKRAGKIFWENSTQKIFLPLGSLFENAKLAWENQFNEAEWQVIKSLKKETEFKRSSVFVSSENDQAPYKGSFYLPLSPFMDSLCTTSGSQMQLYKDMKTKGIPTNEILDFMSQTHPYGKGL